MQNSIIKYMNDYDENKESSYINYWAVNNLYGFTMMLSIFNFRWVENILQFNEGFIKNYDEKSEVGCILKIDVKYLEKIYELHGDLPFLPDRTKIEKVEKLVTNLQDKNEYVVHTESLKQVLNHGLILKKAHRVISFNQDKCLKPYIEMNTKLRA